MELVRVTEAAALAAGRWMGRGDKNGTDGAAVDAMRIMLNSIDMDGIVAGKVVLDADIGEHPRVADQRFELRPFVRPVQPGRDEPDDASVVVVAGPRCRVKAER